jgi:hypothetical protein
MLLIKAEHVSEDGRAPPDYAYCSHAGVTTASHGERRPDDAEHAIANVAEERRGAGSRRDPDVAFAQAGSELSAATKAVVSLRLELALASSP